MNDSVDTQYLLKTEIGCDYFTLKRNIDADPEYYVQGVNCIGTDISKDYAVINVKYDGNIPIAVKCNVPEYDEIVSLQLVQYVPGKISSGNTGNQGGGAGGG